MKILINTFRCRMSRLIGQKLVTQVKLKFLRNRILRKIFDIRYFGLNGIDKTLSEILDFDSGYFVELGANDGVLQSNTLFLEYFKAWRGVLIEPHQQTYNRLINNRAPENSFWNAACVGFDFKNSEIELVFSNLMTSPLEGRNEISDPKLHAKTGEKYWGGNSYIFKAPAKTLNQILKDSKSPKTIDLLSLDVEGAELEVLSGLDHAEFRFRYICVETSNFSAIQCFLKRNNYIFSIQLSKHDYLFRSL